jgi:hypothetical protein
MSFDVRVRFGAGESGHVTGIVVQRHDCMRLRMMERRRLGRLDPDRS